MKYARDTYGYLRKNEWYRKCETRLWYIIGEVHDPFKKVLDFLN
jgi:hypothetical protein